MNNDANLLSILRQRAGRLGDKLAFRLLDRGSVVRELSYAQLAERALCLASQLQASASPGDRVVIACTPGIDYVVSFFATISAGQIAVPVYPPVNRERNERVAAIARDCGARTIVTDAETAPRVAEETLALFTSHIRADEQWAGPGRGVEARSNDLAFLQYTSGSTGTPRGVRLTHANLCANLEAIREGFGLSESTVGMSWLPPYHDMGLIGGILQPVYSGFTCHIMAPEEFVRRPDLWLRAISEIGVTATGAPNFGYQWCVDRAKDAAIPGLDLSSWQVAFCGAEPIAASTLRAFADRFEAHGFRRGAFLPCYGLAEATLYVTGTRHAEGPRSVTVNRSALSEGRVESDEADGLELTSCGTPAPHALVVIADPTTGTRRDDDRVGEIWVAGPSVAKGYSDGTTSPTFGAGLCDGDQRFLRTGDLGFMRGGELFVTGRLKDLLIVRGKNHYPEDIEATLKRRLGTTLPSAVFDSGAPGDPRVTVVQEQRGMRRPVDPVAIRAAVSDAHGLSLHDVVVVPAGSIPRTSSGKISRSQTAGQYRRGELKVIRSVGATIEPSDGGAAATEPLRIARLTVARAIGVNPEDVDLAQPLSAFGVDSIVALQIAHDIQEQTGLEIPFHGLAGGGGLAELLASAQPVEPRIERPRPGDRLPLTSSQRSMLFVEQLLPQGSVNHIAAAVRVRGGLSFQELKRALCQVTARHPILDAAFDEAMDSLTVERGRVTLRHVDGRKWSREDVQAFVAREGRRPFPRSGGEALLRLHHVDLGDDVVLVLVAHHAILDLWSLTLVFREILDAYLGDLDASMAPSWHSVELLTLSPDARAEALAYWKGALAGEIPVVRLPTKRSRAASTPSSIGPVRTLRREVPAQITTALRVAAQRREVSLFSVVLSAYQTALARHSGDRDIAIVTPASLRGDARLSKVVGPLLNPVVLRANLADDPEFWQLARRNRDALAQALAHARLPFAEVVEALGFSRSPSTSPLSRALLLFHTDPDASRPLGALGAGVEGVTLRHRGLELCSIEVPAPDSIYDLTLVVASLPDGRTSLSLSHQANLFDGDVVERFLDDLRAVLVESVDQDRHVSELPTLAPQPTPRAAASDDRNLVQQFRAIAAARPDTTAIVHGDLHFSYAYLDRWSRTIARSIAELGGAGKPAGIYLGPGAELVAAMLGVMRSGAFYVPLDPDLPEARLASMIEAAGLAVLVSTEDQVVGGLANARSVVDVRTAARVEATCAEAELPSQAPAYLMFTSGSTGKPKGVCVSHGNVASLFSAMDREVGCNSSDRVLSVTKATFDISALETLWPLTRGATTVLTEGVRPRRQARGALDFSLFYFGTEGGYASESGYDLLMRGARFADEHGFSAIWTPERHFHDFGGPFSNPSLLGAAVASVTNRIGIRAGSVVAPLHHPVRIAEEWCVVDVLSKGRAGIALASGWNPDDFVFAPDRFANRKDVVFSTLETVRRLWRGEGVTGDNGLGEKVEVRVFPRPVQPELPIWITAAGAPETFERAGAAGAHILTHLLGQSLDDLAKKLTLYREAQRSHGYDRDTHTVTVMLHTFVGDDPEVVLRRVAQPFRNYLRTSVELMARLAAQDGSRTRIDELPKERLDQLVDAAFARYSKEGALFGTPEQCAELADRLVAMGVDEIACLIDFGVDADVVMDHLTHLDRLRQLFVRRHTERKQPLAQILDEAAVSVIQCTPSALRLMVAQAEESTLRALIRARAVLLGGEALPVELAKRLDGLGVTLFNVYGPTETTIWSLLHRVTVPDDEGVPIGRLLANNTGYLLGPTMAPCPSGVVGELLLGGAGVALGYYRDPRQTAERFVPDPFSEAPGARMYRTGDRVHVDAEGVFHFHGRNDDQVKIRGHRAELGDIETALARHPAVAAAAACLAGSEGELRAFFVVDDGAEVDEATLATHMRSYLPDALVPATFTRLAAIPLTANGKIDRRNLAGRPVLLKEAETVLGDDVSATERAIALAWQQVLGRSVSVNDNFFEVGGDSLKLSRVHERLRTELGVDAPLISLFEFPSVRAFARYLSRQGRDEDESAAAARANAQTDARRRRAARARRDAPRRTDDSSPSGGMEKT